MKTAHRAAAVTLAVGLAACGKPTPNASARFIGLTALVPFAGVTAKHPGAVQPYLAATSPGSDDLRFIDQTDLITVLGPGLGLALSVVTDQRPVHLASASLGDGKADVLVAVSAGEQKLQVIDTWSGTPAVAATVSLAADSAGGAFLGAGDEVACAVGMDAAAPGQPARVFLGVNGSPGAAASKLVMVEFTRAPDGVGVTAQAIAPTSQVVLGFRPEEIAVEPTDPNGLAAAPHRLFIATRDPVTTARGLAVIDTSAGATPSTWAPALLDTRGAGTLSVAAAYVDERVVDTAGLARPYCSPEGFTGTPKRAACARRAPETCGVDKPIACGVAKLVPPDPPKGIVGGLATDPAPSAVRDPIAATSSVPADPGNPACAPGATPPCAVPTQAYLTPIPVPGMPLHIGVARAPSKGKYRLIANDDGLPSTDCPTATTATSPLTYLASGAGARYTSAAAAVSSSDGDVYWLDLSRWSPVSDVSPATGGASRTGVTAAFQLTTTSTGLGLWNDLVVEQAAKAGNTAPPPQVVSTTDQLPLAIQVHPGFTDSDTWSIVYQGQLPGLAGRVALLVADADKRYLAVQSPSGVSPDPGPTSAAHWVTGAVVSDPALGVHVGDTVTLPDSATCETTVVATVAAPATLGGALLPGGALELDHANDVPAGCVDALIAAGGRTKASVRASGFVLTNGKLGYLGRPEMDKAFQVAWADETSLTGEALALARKARRIFYPSIEGPCPYVTTDTTLRSEPVGCYAGFPRMKDPLEPGPLVGFRLGHAKDSKGNDLSFVRDDAIVFTTTSGLSTTRSVPTSGGVLPGAAVSFDWTQFDALGVTGHDDDPIRLLVPYLDDQVLVVSPTGSAFGATLR